MDLSAHLKLLHLIKVFLVTVRCYKTGSRLINDETDENVGGDSVGDFRVMTSSVFEPDLLWKKRCFSS